MTRFSLLLAVLFALSAPAVAAKWSVVPKPVQRDITEWESLHGKCTFWRPRSAECEKCVPQQELDKICQRANTLEKKLIPQGYCIYGHGVIGRAGRGHCFTLER